MERKGELRMTNKLLKELNELHFSIKDAQVRIESALCELNKLRAENDLDKNYYAGKFNEMFGDLVRKKK